MTLTGSSDLYIVELVIYLILFPVTLYLGWRHGKAGLLGYFYLNAACAVRIAADIVSLLPANRDAGHPTVATAVLSSIGLSPLLLAISGFIHEAHVRLVDLAQGTRQAKTIKRWLWALQIQVHGIAVLGMVLAIIGNLKLATDETSLTPSEINTNEHLRSAGAVILLVLWACLAQYALYLLYLTQSVRPGSPNISNPRQMVSWILFAMPWVALRCISSILYTFDRSDKALNPITGALWVKVIFVVLASLGAVIGLCISGWVSRHVQKEPTPGRYVSQHDMQQETAQFHKRSAELSSIEVPAYMQPLVDEQHYSRAIGS